MAIGIDVSKAILDVTVLVASKTLYLQVKNELTGWCELCRWLDELEAQDNPVCMESTGVYSLGVANHLYQQGHTVSVVNPARISAFAGSLLQRNKTDKSDSFTIALFCQRMQPDPWQPQSGTAKRLRALSRFAADLDSDRTRCISRLEGMEEDNPAWRYIKTQIDLIEAQQRDVQAEIDKLIQDDDELRQQRDLLVSIVGIGEKTASALLGELPDLSRFTSSRQLVAYAGLSPQRFESGSSVHRRTKMSKIGAARLRHLLYFPAMAAKKHNPHLKIFAERLKEAGKEKMVVVGAVMRKLLVLVYAVLKSGKPYDREYGFSA